MHSQFFPRRFLPFVFIFRIIVTILGFFLITIAISNIQSEKYLSLNIAKNTNTNKENKVPQYLRKINIDNKNIKNIDHKSKSNSENSDSKENSKSNSDSSSDSNKIDNTIIKMSSSAVLIAALPKITLPFPTAPIPPILYGTAWKVMKSYCRYMCLKCAYIINIFVIYNYFSKILRY